MAPEERNERTDMSPVVRPAGAPWAETAARRAVKMCVEVIAARVPVKSMW
jgi:hypothetical protein